MADPHITLSLHQETRLSLAPLVPHSIITVPLTFQQATFSAFTKRPSRRVTSHFPITEDEESFKASWIASSSSIYFRCNRKYPRAILWRCLHDNRVLELRSVDLDRPRGVIGHKRSSSGTQKPNASINSTGASGSEKKDASLILRFEFPAGSAIHYDGIALADTESPDIISVFALMTSGDLYTFSLRPDFFIGAEASDVDPATYVKVFKPASFTLSAAHRLFASSASDLIITLGDGRVLRLKKKTWDDGAKWEERAYGDAHWGSSLRGLISWRGSTSTVNYNGNVLLQGTVVSAALSPLGTDGAENRGQFLYAVCLDHTLKAWNAAGKMVFSRDLLGKRRDLQETPRVMLNAGASGLMQIFETKQKALGDDHYLVTFSPQDSGLFKFWAMRDPELAEFGGVQDMFPDNLLKIPDPNDEAIWTMAGFWARPSTEVGQDLEIWVLIRLNRRYKLYRRDLNMRTLAEDWQRDWTTTAVNVTKDEAWKNIPSIPLPQEPESVAERWLEFILAPGRIPETTLENALSIYCATEKRPYPSKQQSLKQKLGSSIAPDILLGQGFTDPTIARETQAKVHRSWQTFWSIATELDQVRWEPLSLAVDEFTNSAWIVFSDGCSVIRNCSAVEVLVRNDPLYLSQYANMLEMPSIEMADEGSTPALPDELATLLGAAARFRLGFSRSLQLTCKVTLQALLWTDASHATPVQMQGFYEECDMENEIRNEEYTELAAALNDLGGFGGLSNGLFTGLTSRLPSQMSQIKSDLQSTLFGLRHLIAASQDTIETVLQILTDLLYVVVFVDVEVDREENPMADFDAPQVFEQLVEQLKEWQVRQWLATNACPEPILDHTESPRASFSTQQAPQGPMERRISTILENLFATDILPQSYSTSTSQNASQSNALTGMIDDLMLYVVGKSSGGPPFEDALVAIEANLIKNGNIDLAIDFLRFLPSTPWAMYIRGRLSLATGDLDEAAAHFQKAAFALSRPPKQSYAAASSYLLTSLDEGFFASGLPNYYAHLITLFQPLPHSAQYLQNLARLGLLYTPPPSHTATQQPPPSNPTHNRSNSASSLTQRTQSTKPTTSVDAAQIQDFLSTLFSASLTLGDYTTAYTALTRTVDSGIKRQGVGRFVNALASDPADTKHLTTFPWLGELGASVDTYLFSKVTASLPDQVPSMSKRYSFVGERTKGAKTRGGRRWSSELDECPAIAIESTGAIEWHKLLYVFRMQRGDARGAAEVLVKKVVERKEDTEKSVKGRKGVNGTKSSGIALKLHDGGWEARERKEVEEYLLALNALAIIGDGSNQGAGQNVQRTNKDSIGKASWVLVGGNDVLPEGGDLAGKKDGKNTRRVVTLADVREWYSGVLDRKSIVEQGRFGLLGWEDDGEEDGDANEERMQGVE
ncbi:hypothetical protein MMC25_007974 [Agyrium rufum]|nr:hypothetical protein [Agyrium rufum]